MHLPAPRFVTRLALPVLASTAMLAGPATAQTVTETVTQPAKTTTTTRTVTQTVTAPRETTTATETKPSTAPAHTTTVTNQTTTVQAGPASESSNNTGVPTWGWILIGAAVVLIVALLVDVRRLSARRNATDEDGPGAGATGPRTPAPGQGPDPAGPPNPQGQRPANP